jgi:hypothetical protein
VARHRETVVKLYYDTQQDAEHAAAEIRAEGLKAVMARPGSGERSVTVIGPGDVVERFSERLVSSWETHAE